GGAGRRRGRGHDRDLRLGADRRAGRGSVPPRAGALGAGRRPGGGLGARPGDAREARRPALSGRVPADLGPLAEPAGTLIERHVGCTTGRAMDDHGTTRSLNEPPDEARDGLAVYTSPVTAERTESMASEARLESRTDWALIIAMDCQALGAVPEALALGSVNELSIGRGPERKFERTGSRARLDLPDRWISSNHARLVRTGDRWSIEDEGSRNGSRVHGERIERKILADGDVVECGGNDLVLRS